MVKKKKEDKIMCEGCLVREAKVEFAREPTFALTHGFGIQNICRQCFIEKIEDEIEKINENLKKQKDLLEKEEKNSK